MIFNDMQINQQSVDFDGPHQSRSVQISIDRLDEFVPEVTRYNILGHMKLATILISGFVLFGEEVDVTRMLGAALTCAGVVAYTHVKMQATRMEKVTPASVSLPTTTKELTESVSTIGSESFRQLDALMRSSGSAVGKPAE